VQLQILDAQGKVIRTEKMEAHQGLNGAYWDLFYDTPTDVRLLTTPPENPHIWDEPRYQGKTYRSIIHWGANPHTGTPIAAPGHYQVRLTVEGRSYTQPFEVVKDPAVKASGGCWLIRPRCRCRSPTRSAKPRTWSTPWRSGASRSRIN
jgi:hypothetical protein